jgi:hypothetical protein
MYRFEYVYAYMHTVYRHARSNTKYTRVPEKMPMMSGCLKWHGFRSYTRRLTHAQVRSSHLGDSIAKRRQTHMLAAWKTFTRRHMQEMAAYLDLIASQRRTCVASAFWR